MPNVDGSVGVEVCLQPVIGLTEFELKTGLKRRKPQGFRPPHCFPPKSDSTDPKEPANHQGISDRMAYCSVRLQHPRSARFRIPEQPNLETDQHRRSDGEKERNGVERRVEGNHGRLTVHGAAQEAC